MRVSLEPTALQAGTVTPGLHWAPAFKGASVTTDMLVRLRCTQSQRAVMKFMQEVTSLQQVTNLPISSPNGMATTGFRLGEGANGPVFTIVLHGNYIYVGGGFTSIGGVKANGIARFDGSEWTALGSGVDGDVYAMAFKDDQVYVGGLSGRPVGRPRTTLRDG